MPTYQYACTACGHQLEAVQSFADEPLTECPACEGRLRKLFSSVGIVFKGSGFYRTDSRSGAKNETASSGSSDSSGASGGSGATSSDSKPAAATKTESSKADKKPASTPAAS